jgi:HEAT repeat protein/predicted DNA-binding WGR domain protein
MRYEFHEGTSSKFWDIELRGKSFTVRWGRIGTEGQTQTKRFATDDEARAAHDRLVAEKLKKGYRAAGGGSAKERPAPALVGNAGEKATSRPDEPRGTGGRTSVFLHVSHHQFSLEDSKNTGEDFAFDSIDDGLEAARHGVVAHLRRAAGTVPIVIEVRNDAPARDESGAFDMVTEASFESPSGTLVLASPEATAPDEIAVPRGWLRVQVRQAERDTTPYDDAIGADHYRVILWPAPKAATRVLHSRDVKDDVVFAPDADLDRLNAALSSDDETERCLGVVDAVRHLRAGKRDAMALLERAGSDRAPVVRAVLVSALGLAGKTERANLFAQIDARANDDSPEVRRRVPEALARLGGSDGAARLIALLASQDADLAKSAARRVAAVSEHVALPSIEPLLTHTRTETRLAALEVFRSLGEVRGWHTVAAAGEAVRALVKDKNRDVKQLAASLVENLGAPVADLLKLAKSKNSDQRASAATSLGQSHAPEAFAFLVAMMNADKDIGVRRAAAEGLGQLGDRRAIEELAKHLEDGTFNLNWAAARSLGQLGGADATRLLWKYASMPDADERFGYIGERAAEAISSMLSARAQRASGESPDSDGYSPDVDESQLKISSLLASGDERLCERALKMLESSTDVDAAAAALSHESETVVEQALRSLGAMISRVRTDEIRARARSALAPRAPTIARIKSPRVRLGWLDALYWVGGDLAFDVAVTAAKDPLKNVRAKAAGVLGRVGADRAFGTLADMLRDPEANVSREAAIALGFCTVERSRAKDALAGFVSKAKGAARAAAEEALERLGGSG